MDEQGYRFGVGVLVVASLAICVLLILFFGAAPNFLADRYQVTIRFDSAPGVATDTPVRLNGVQIGRVKTIKLLPEDGVDLTLELDSTVSVKAGKLPRIDVGSLITGDAVLEFVPPSSASLLERFDGTGGSPRDGRLDENEMLLVNTPIKDGDFVDGGRVAADPLDSLLNMQEQFASALGSIETAGTEITGLTQDIRQLIGGGDGQLQQISQQVEDTIANFNQTLDSIEEVFRDQRLRTAVRNLDTALQSVSESLPQLIVEANSVMAQAKDTLSAFTGAGQAASETMQHVSEFTAPLAGQGERVVGDALKTLNDLDALLLDLRQVAGRVNNSQGTVGKLLDDDRLYYSLINTLQNVELLTQRLEPIVHDVRVFTDKAARGGPSSFIDIRGAVLGVPKAAGLK